LDREAPVVEFLLRSSFPFSWWRVGHGARQSTDRSGASVPDAEIAAMGDLSRAIQHAVSAGQRLLESLRQSVENEPLANAASICRWELLVLRERIRETSVPSSLRSTQVEALRAVDAAAAAAHMLGNGYRFHNLDRICQGGETLETQLGVLDRLHARLNERLSASRPGRDTPVRAS
jgi:hypothetical protein